MVNEKLAQHAKKIKTDTRMQKEKPKEKMIGTDKKRHTDTSENENR